MVLECGGNGRAFFDPPARGSQRTNGGAGCAQWTGVRLKDALEAAGIATGAIDTAHDGADTHLSGDPAKKPLSRGVRLEKALEEYAMIVWAMNGQDLPAIHGGPVRLIIPGWPGSASHKWLTRMTLRDVEHDGQGMSRPLWDATLTLMIEKHGMVEPTADERALLLDYLSSVYPPASKRGWQNPFLKK